VGALALLVILGVCVWSWVSFRSSSPNSSFREGAGKKLAALQVVVTKLKQAPGPFASKARQEQFATELGGLIGDFRSMPFDARANRKEAEAIINLFEQELRGRFRGLAYSNLEASVLSIASDLVN
jgi:hypothetical protein